MGHLDLPDTSIHDWVSPTQYREILNQFRFTCYPTMCMVFHTLSTPYFLCLLHPQPASVYKLPKNVCGFPYLICISGVCVEQQCAQVRVTFE